MRAGFVVATSSWQMLEAVWPANDRPMPPSGSALARLGDLRLTPPGLGAVLREKFSGDAPSRIEAGIGLMEGALELLRETERPWPPCTRSTLSTQRLRRRVT